MHVCMYTYGQDGCASRGSAFAQGQCFMRFGMSSISLDGLQDLFPKHETLNLNPKPYNLDLT